VWLKHHTLHSLCGSNAPLLRSLLALRGPPDSQVRQQKAASEASLPSPAPGDGGRWALAGVAAAKEAAWRHERRRRERRRRSGFQP